MAVVVIGGQASGVGKTGVVCALIAGMGERRWTAIKISQVEAGEGEVGDFPMSQKRDPSASSRQAIGHPTSGVAIWEEREAGSGTDSARYLAAGAERAFWVRTRRGELEAAMPGVRALMEGAGDVIVESNSVMGFLRPDFYGMVIDPEVIDFKASARRYLERADGLVVVGAGGANFEGMEGIRQFGVEAPGYGSVAFREHVAKVLHNLGK